LTQRGIPTQVLTCVPSLLLLLADQTGSFLVQLKAAFLRPGLWLAGEATPSRSSIAAGDRRRRGEACLTAAGMASG
jgi:hypothetical protein